MLNSEVIIRHANPDDVLLTLSFIRKKAEFDRSMGAIAGTVETTEERLRNTLFNEMPFAKVLFAQVSRNVVGFALYYFRYSSFAGQPSLWLDDLYVDAPMRSQGIGTILMTYLAKIANDNHCTHIAWTASANNGRGIEFYRRIGAEVTEKKDNTLFFKVDTNAINNLLQSARSC